MSDQISQPAVGSNQMALLDKAKSGAMPQRFKLEATIGIERVIVPLLLAALVVFIGGIFLGPSRRSSGLVSPEVFMLIIFGGAGGLLSIAGTAWLLTDNYYLIERESGRLLVHKGIRFFGKDYPLLEKDSIMAIGVNCGPKKYKGAQYGWLYTPVIYLKDGGRLQLSSKTTDMSCAGLPAINQDIRQWAAALECSWVECPANQSFEAQDFIGKGNTPA